MSLNLGLEPAGLVLRVHRPLLSRARLMSVQRVREALAERGLVVPVPLPWRGAKLFRCGGRWAEIELFVPSERPAATPESYAWMFRAMGSLDRVLAALDLPVPRPVVAAYGPPSTLQHWLGATEAAVVGDPQASETARWVRDLVRRLRAQWVSPSELPVQLVHGDIRLGNVRRATHPSTRCAAVYFDFGFLARRPRIHELAYALAWMMLRPDSRGTGDGFAWEVVPHLVGDYERAAQTSLTPAEWRALAPYTAAVPLYLAAIACFVPDPVGHLRNETRLTFLRIAEWLLEHPDAPASHRPAR